MTLLWFCRTAVNTCAWASTGRAQEQPRGYRKMQRSKFNFVASPNKAPQSSTQAEMQALLSLVHAKGSPTWIPECWLPGSVLPPPCPGFPEGKAALTSAQPCPTWFFFCFLQPYAKPSIKDLYPQAAYMIWLHFIHVCNVWLYNFL